MMRSLRTCYLTAILCVLQMVLPGECQDDVPAPTVLFVTPQTRQPNSMRQPIESPTDLMTPLASISLDRSNTLRKPSDYAVQTPDFQQMTPSTFSFATEPTFFQWQATAFWHHPLYFEDPCLERYGMSHGILQLPFSSAHYFGNVLSLPYHLVQTHPLSTVYE